MTKSTTTDKPTSTHDAASENREYLTFTVDRQMLGVPVCSVQDVLRSQRLTRIPKAPDEVAGALNLRGRIITAIDLRRRLGLRPTDDTARKMSVVVDHGDEIYSLLVDKVGDVLSVSADSFEANPSTLEPRWCEVSQGVHRLEGRLMTVLNVANLLRIGNA